MVPWTFLNVDGIEIKGRVLTSYSLGQLGKEKLCRGRHSKLLFPVDAHGNALFTWKTSVQYYVCVPHDTRNLEHTKTSNQQKVLLFSATWSCQIGYIPKTIV